MSSKVAMNDILIVLPGITGSILTKHGNPIWGPVPQSIIGYIESVLDSSGARFFDALRISNDDPDADSLGDGIEATGLVPYTFVPGLDCFDGYSGLRNRLCHTFDLRIGEANHEDSPAANYVEFPYDWRRDNRVSARRLKKTRGSRTAEMARFQKVPRCESYPDWAQYGRSSRALLR